jgi:hypothetical protein
MEISAFCAINQKVVRNFKKLLEEEASMIQMPNFYYNNDNALLSRRGSRRREKRLLNPSLTFRHFVP